MRCAGPLYPLSRTAISFAPARLSYQAGPLILATARLLKRRPAIRMRHTAIRLRRTTIRLRRTAICFAPVRDGPLMFAPVSLCLR